MPMWTQNVNSDIDLLIVTDEVLIYCECETGLEENHAIFYDDRFMEGF